MMRQRDAEAELNLPAGFRFHPTDEELVIHYLCRKISYQSLPATIIAEIDLYRYNPWQLPDMALFGTREWYFFTPRDRKYPNGSRPNRAAGSGYWKATGSDKPVRPTGGAKTLGIKKALVFYSGKAPKGTKTDWIMHEYRLAEPNPPTNRKGSLRLDDWVLCRLYNKKNNWQTTTQAPKEEPSMEEAGSESSTAAESDVDNDLHIETSGRPSQALDSLQPAGNETKEMFQMSDLAKEDNDWFMDLNLDDLQNSIATFGGTSAAADLTGQYYSSLFLSSPSFKPYQANLPHFWSS